ncbi:hypothetical protein FRC04_002278 [Tulasnella sp. 424]|nr:hypothetical protein FRC04_002278 [Tulasnella sp. 424]
MAYDRFAQPYDTDRVLNPDKTLNTTAYAEYSPLYIPVSFVMTYLIAFILTTAMVVATILDHGKEILRAMKPRDTEDDDVHARLMRKYPEVPGLWYAAVLLVSLGLAIAAVKIVDVKTPVWALFFAVILSFSTVIPGSYIYSCSGNVASPNLMVELIGGSIWHGQPITVMVFKTFTVQWLQSGLAFTENLKLGHYLKIPPRCTFITQLMAAVVVTAFQIALQEWIFSAVPDLCEEDQRGNLTCPDVKVFYTASIIW